MPSAPERLCSAAAAMVTLLALHVPCSRDGKARLHDPAALEAALLPLLRLTLWKSHRAADLQGFHFGEKRVLVSQVGPRRGQVREVGDYALHVQCAWRIRGPNGIVVASRDRYYRAGPDPVPAEDDWDWSKPGANRCDVRIQDWLATRAYTVERIGADTMGGFVLSLADNFALDVFPDDSLGSEHWRLLRPGDASAHVVVTGSGIET